MYLHTWPHSQTRSTTELIQTSPVLWSDSVSSVSGLLKLSVAKVSLFANLPLFICGSTFLFKLQAWDYWKIGIKRLTKYKAWFLIIRFSRHRSRQKIALSLWRWKVLSEHSRLLSPSCWNQSSSSQVGTGSDLVHGLPKWHSGEESPCQGRRGKRCRFDPWVGKIPWNRKWQPIPVFLPGKFHRQRSLEGYSPWGRKESDMTEWLTLSHTSLILGLKAHRSNNVRV